MYARHTQPLWHLVSARMQKVTFYLSLSLPNQSTILLSFFPPFSHLYLSHVTAARCSVLRPRHYLSVCFSVFPPVCLPLFYFPSTYYPNSLSRLIHSQTMCHSHTKRSSYHDLNYLHPSLCPLWSHSSSSSSSPSSAPSVHLTGLMEIHFNIFVTFLFCQFHLSSRRKKFNTIFDFVFSFIIGLI